MTRASQLGILGSLVLVLTGCGSAPDVEVVDLNRVLDAVAELLDEGGDKPAVAQAGDAQPADQKPAAEKSADAKPADAAAGEVLGEVVAIEPIDPAKEDPAKQKDFLIKLAAKLNEMHMIKSTIGCQLNAEGAIEGFADANANMTKEETEERLFVVEIDAERNRLIASDTYDNHRDHSYHPRPGGFFMGYMLGSMLGRQNTHFAASGAKPDFGNRQMSPKTYHSAAVSSARTSSAARSAGSARSTGGSRGFSFGK